MGLVNKQNDQFSLVCYTDSNYGGCLDTRRSTSSWIVMLANTPVIWRSERQSITATSTCEAEFVAASTAVKEVVWMRNFLYELGVKLQPTFTYIDNQGTIKLINNNQVHSKTKHLDIKLHFIRDLVAVSQQIVLQYIET